MFNDQNTMVLAFMLLQQLQRKDQKEERHHFFKAW